MLSKTQLSHKYYFFPVIVEAISEGKEEISFDEVAERMIVEAWYPVVEHHIHLGAYKDKKPNDWIEKSIYYIQNIIHAKAEIKPDELIKKIRELATRGDSNIVECKEMITRYAPYRLLSPFLNAKESDFQIEEHIFKKIEEVNAQDSLPYTIDRTSKKLLGRKIVFDPEWSKFIKDNCLEILGWINNERLTYLQKRNPQMPGLVFKMKPIKRDRRLEDVRVLWKELIRTGEFQDIFSGEFVDIEDFEMDHFIPWSYVACDELWNLGPIAKRINIDKSNYLAPEEYINLFVSQQKKCMK